MQVNLPVAESGLLLRQRLVRGVVQKLEAGGMAEDGAEPEKLEKARGIQPEAILIDRQLPGPDGTAATRKIRQRSPDATDALRVDTETRAAVSAHVSGKIKAVDTAAGTITITVESGRQLVLGVVSNATITVNDAAVCMAELCRYIGANVDATFSAGERMMFEIRVDA